MREVVIVGGTRTAIGNYLGALQDVSAIDPGNTALKEATKKVGVDAGMIQEVVAGQCNQASVAGNSARHIALKSGCPVESAAFTMHQQCASSMRGAELISQDIMLGKIDVGAAVGVARAAGLGTCLSLNRFNFFNPTLGGAIMHEFIGR